MTLEKLNQLYNLLDELRHQRLKELDTEYPEKNIHDMSEEEIYELDDYDCLVEHVDAIMSILEQM